MSWLCLQQNIYCAGAEESAASVEKSLGAAQKTVSLFFTFLYDLASLLPVP